MVAAPVPVPVLEVRTSMFLILVKTSTSQGFESCRFGGLLCFLGILSSFATLAQYILLISPSYGFPVPLYGQDSLAEDQTSSTSSV